MSKGLLMGLNPAVRQALVELCATRNDSWIFGQLGEWAEVGVVISPEQLATARRAATGKCIVYFKQVEAPHTHALNQLSWLTLDTWNLGLGSCLPATNLGAELNVELAAEGVLLPSSSFRTEQEMWDLIG